MLFVIESFNSLNKYSAWEWQLDFVWPSMGLNTIMHKEVTLLYKCYAKREHTVSKIKCFRYKTLRYKVGNYVCQHFSPYKHTCDPLCHTCSVLFSKMSCLLDSWWLGVVWGSGIRRYTAYTLLFFSLHYVYWLRNPLWCASFSGALRASFLSKDGHDISMIGLFSLSLLIWVG